MSEEAKDQTAAAAEGQPAVETETKPDPISELRTQFEQFQRTIVNHLASLNQPRPEPAQEKSGPVTDAQLWEMAKQGDQRAFDEYQARIARREVAQVTGAERREASVRAQIGALYQNYPELTDPTHPLHQRAIQFKGALMGMGQKDTLQTDLDAMLRAVADSRGDIQPRPQARPPRTQAGGQPSVSHRAEPSSTRQAPKLEPEEARLARIYGVKDPAKAKERFQSRNQEGRSAISPTIAAALREEE